MLSKAQIKYIRSLTQQKYRKEHNVFIAEGDKIAREWLNSSASIQHIAALEGWMNAHDALIAKHPEAHISVIPEHILSSVSTLQTPNQVLLVVSMPAKEEIIPGTGWTLALDGIQDPGNMGTIIRIADWFGIGQIVCSEGCVDVYNPKVVQAAMGGHLRVKFLETRLEVFLSSLSIPVLAATLEGRSIYEMPSFTDAVLLIGNESKGIDPGLLSNVAHQVTIPRRGGAESLNAAVSAGILCACLMPR